jgi:hypothetical protein
MEVLRGPQVIAAEVQKHRNDGGLERDLASIEKVLAEIASRQTRTARAIAAIDDDDAAAPLVAELKALAIRKTAVEHERNALKQRLADAASEAAHLRTVTQWCDAVTTKLQVLTFEEKRLALTALGVDVRVWREGAVDDAGQPLPRWSMSIQPGGPDSRIVLPATYSMLRLRRRHEM